MVEMTVKGQKGRLWLERLFPSLSNKQGRRKQKEKQQPPKKARITHT